MNPVNILMVDDQASKLLTYEAMLGGLGQNLVKAQSAREALAHLLREDFAVVLMDVNMPELDGFELAALIREHPRCRRTAIVFVSAVHLSDVDRLRGYAIGAVDYVSVPIVPEILRAKIGVFVDLYNKTAALEDLNRTLEERVGSRTIELERSIAQLRDSERQLIKQSDALAEQDRRKNVFLAMLAHELRNPLQPICMLLELGRMPGAPQRFRDEERPIVERQVAQLVRLVDDLLDASRITSGKLELRKSLHELAPIVATAVEAVRPLAHGKEHALEVRMPAAPIGLECDAARLTQVFQNLLNNAVKFTPRGGRIALVAQVEDGTLAVRVTDTGAGLSPDECAKAFEMFYQGQGEGGLPQGGLGLGLALVKQLVELHGGRVSVTSAGRGDGSEFLVRLPVASTPPKVSETRSPAGMRAAGRRVLVVDDNRDAADSLVALLEAEGASASAVYGGADALAAMRSAHHDIVILDLGMPGIDGYETARAIRNAGGGRRSTLVALTGWGGEDVERKAQAAGFDLHLVKPVTFDAFLPALVPGAST